jgi:creatinine amidohydrolase
MGFQRLGDLPWTEVEEMDRAIVVPILPVGAVEAHGPHLPLLTDGIIAEAMAEAGATRLAATGRVPLILPTLHYTPAPFAADFPGTVSLRSETLEHLLVDLATSLGRHAFRLLVVANAHLDPTHRETLRRAVGGAEAAGGATLVVPDVARRHLAARLGEEFQSGACHAGRYEGSVVLARRPDLVRDELRRGLAPNPSSLVTAIQEGKKSFEEAGGPLAYFGDPAAATASEGERTIEVLGEILAEAVFEALGQGRS